MDSAEISLSPGVLTIKKRAGLLDNLRRTFANFIKPPDQKLTPPKILSSMAYSRQNMTLPRLPGSRGQRNSEVDGCAVFDELISPSHILMTERLVVPRTLSGISMYQPQAKRLSMAGCAETPQAVRAELIRLDTRSGGRGELMPRKDRQRVHGHAFCAIPLELDTFCDYCNQPIWGLGWGPVCQRCADCHMTCHWLCKDKVRVKCESSPPTIRQFDEVDDFESTPNGSIETCSSSSTSDPTIAIMKFRTRTASLGSMKVRLPYASEIDSPGHSPMTRAVSCEPSGETKSPIPSANGVSSQPSLLRSPGRTSSTIQNNAVTVGDVEQQANRRFTTPNGLILNGLVSADGRRPQVPTNNRGQQLQPPASSTLRPGSQFSLFGSNYSSLSASVESPPSTPTPSQSDTLYYTAIESPIAFNGKLEGISEIDTCGNESLAKVQTYRNRASLHQSILRRPTESVRSSVRRHTSMIASLSYDISSLDHADMAQRGISVRQLSPTLNSGSKSCGGSKSASSSPTKDLPVVMSSLMQATQAAAISGHQVGLEGLNFAKVAIGPREVLPWKPLELAHRLEIFNGNEFGLTARMIPSKRLSRKDQTTRLLSGDCEGQVRVHINLIRPVRMVLSSRPSSIFDVVGSRSETASSDDTGDSDDSEEDKDVVLHHLHEEDSDGEDGLPNSEEMIVRLRRKPSLLPAKVSSFRLPRGSSKLLHVRLSTTAHQVISSLLDRFNIEDNPQKFAIYEHTIVSDQEVSVRKLFDNESPLGLLLQWTSVDQQKMVAASANLDLQRERFNRLLDVKRLVLQENETGDIEWTCFSQAELHNFLGILNREEMDYRRRIQLKYQIRKREILRLLALRTRTAERRTTNQVEDEGVTNKNSNHENCEMPPISVEEVTDQIAVDSPAEVLPADGKSVSVMSPSLPGIDRVLLTKAQKKQQRKEKKRLEKDEKLVKRKRPDWLRRKK